MSELRKVIWPTRRELRTYTIVAMMFILVMVVIVTSLDYAFTKLVFWAFGSAGAGAGAPEGWPGWRVTYRRLVACAPGSMAVPGEEQGLDNGAAQR